MSIHRLVFDATLPDDSANVGAFVRSADGTLITHTDNGGKLSLDVNVANAIDVSLSHTTDSVKIGDGTDFLAINNDGSINAVVSATNLDIRDLAFSTDKVDVSGSSVSVTGDVNVTQGTSPWVVSATNLDIRDLAFATDKVDVSGSSVSITGDVNVTQGTSPWVVSATNLDIRDLAFATDKVDVSGSSVTVNDAALANTAIKAVAQTIGTSAAQILTAGDLLASRKYVKLYNNAGSKVMYIGESGVTTSSGFPIFGGGILELRAGASAAIFAIGSDTGLNMRTLQAA
jgi:lipopolysaccharide export system protein LptA